MSDVVFERRGAGPPLVLVHGLGSRWEAFSPVIDALAERHDVIALDLPGFGRSPLMLDVAPGPVGYARWLAGVLGDLGLDRPHVVGNSMGAAVALELGRLGVVSRVTAFAPVGFWETPGVMWCRGVLTTLRTMGGAALPLVRRAAGSLPVRTALVGAVVARPSRMSSDEAVLAVEGLVAAPAFPAALNDCGNYRFDQQEVGRLRDIPVTIAWGTRDLLLPYRTQSRRARALLPTARHLDLPGCGHLPFFDDAGLCAQVVLDRPE